jgi:uncharacterized protein
MAKEFLGNGWRFPIRPDAAGGLGYVAGDDNVEQSLRLALMTATGERAMRPTFGSKARQLVFAPGSLLFLHQLETTVRETVRDWEPRVELEEVLAETDPRDETRITVSIRYRVRATNTKQNLVFPFYLGTAERT